MRELLPFLPVALLVAGAALILGDRWLRRPTFGVEILTVGTLGTLTAFGLVGILIGAPVHDVGGELAAPLVMIGRAGTALLYCAIGFGLVRQPPAGPGRLVWGGVTAFGVLAGIAQMLNPGPIDGNLLLLPLVALVLWRSAGTQLDHVVTAAQWGLWALAITSLAAAATPGGWVETGGSFIGLPVRLVGVTAHPNHLGPYLVYLLLLNLVRPPQRLPAWVAWGVPGALLLLTQSKTALGGLLVGAAIIWWIRVGTGLVGRHRWLPAAVLVVVLGSVALVVVELPQQELLTPQEIEDLTTLTGRSEIWGAGIAAFREQPVFGAGSDIYLQYARETNQTWAGQAHNEFVQTLAAEGMVGTAGLLAYLAVLLFLGVRLIPVSRGASLAFVVAFVLRWLTETPVRQLSYEHVLLIALLIAWSRMAPERSTLQPVAWQELWAPVTVPGAAAARPDGGGTPRPRRRGRMGP